MSLGVIWVRRIYEGDGLVVEGDCRTGLRVTVLIILEGARI